MVRWSFPRLTKARARSGPAPPLRRGLSSVFAPAGPCLAARCVRRTEQVTGAAEQLWLARREWAPTGRSLMRAAARDAATSTWRSRPSASTRSSLTVRRNPSSRTTRPRTRHGPADPPPAGPHRRSRRESRSRCTRRDQSSAWTRPAMTKPSNRTASTASGSTPPSTGGRLSDSRRQDRRASTGSIREARSDG